MNRKEKVEDGHNGYETNFTLKSITLWILFTLFEVLVLYTRHSHTIATNTPFDLVFSYETVVQFADNRTTTSTTLS